MNSESKFQYLDADYFLEKGGAEASMDSPSKSQPKDGFESADESNDRREPRTA